MVSYKGMKTIALHPKKTRMPERQVNNMNRIENLVDLDKLNELKVSELKKLNKLLG